MKKILLFVFFILTDFYVFSQNNAADNLSIGKEYAAQKEWDKAEQYFKQAVKIDDTCIEAYLQLAEVYKNKEQYESARQAYLKIIAQDANNADAYFGIGKLYYTVERYEDCIKFMRIAMQKYYEKNSNSLFDASYHMAYSYYKLKKYKDALTHFKLSSSFFSEDEDLKKKISEIEKMM